MNGILLQSCVRTLDNGKELAQHRTMQRVTYTQAKRNLNAVIDKAISDRTPVLITSRGGGNVVIVSDNDWASVKHAFSVNFQAR